MRHPMARARLTGTLAPFRPRLHAAAATVSTILYYGYMFMIAWCFFLMTGAIGFVSSLTFVNKIYGAIKVD